MTGERIDVFCKILSSVSAVSITKPGKFKAESGKACVKATVKAEEGLLFLLDRNFFFLPKPPTSINYDDIHQVDAAQTSPSPNPRQPPKPNPESLKT